MVRFFTIIFLLLIQISNVQAATYYSKASGNWGTAATWGTACGTGTGAVPTASDTVIICAGHTITMNGNPGNCFSLTISGTASWSNKTTNVGAGGLVMNGGTITGTLTGTLNVAGPFTTSATNNIDRCNLNISGTSTISSIVNITSATGIKTFTDLIITGTFNNTANETITINGNLQNDGTYTVGTGQVTFGGATSNTITGTSTTAFTSLRINKGASTANVLDVQSLITLTDGGLTLTNGTLKLSNSSITITPFIVDVTASPYRIPATAGLWCNSATINSGNINWSVAGLLRISGGTVNLGNTADNSFKAVNSGTTQLTIEGGTFNVAGRISRAVATDNITFTMSGGTINVPTVGSTTVGLSPIQVDQTGSSFTMSGGTIVIHRSGAGNLGFTATAGTVGITGGTIQFGDASTPASQTMLMNCTFSIANLTVNSSNTTCQLAANLTVLQSINISAGTLNANNLNITLGSSWTNIGTFTPGTGTLTLNGAGTQTITKSGGETFNNFTVNKSSGTILLASNIQINSTLTMTSGNIDCGSNMLTLGISTASTGTLTYTTGTLIGNFKRWINSTGTGILFPGGTSSYYRSALLTFTNLVGGTLTANFVSSDPSSNGLPLIESGKTIANQYTEGYWDMTAANGLSSTDYAIELTGTGFTSYPVSSSTRILYRTSSGNPWTLNGTHVAGTGSTAKRSVVSGATAQFGFGKPSCTSYSAASITGSTSVCTNAAGEAYSVTNTPGNTYTWVITGGAQASGGTTNSITVNWGAIGMTGDVQVTEQNDCGDNNTAVNLAVYVSPITTSAITGATIVSINETGVAYSVTNTPGYTYTWSFPGGGGTLVSGQGTNAVTVNWGDTAGTYSVRVDVTRFCGAPDFQALSVVSVRNIFYSRASGNWTTASTWSTTCGGAAGTTTPGVDDEVIICSGNTVTMNGNSGACRKLTINGTSDWTLARTTDVGNGGIIINSTGNITGTAAGILTSTGGLTLNSNTNITSTTVTIRLQTSAQNIATSGTPGALNLLDITTTATNTGTLTIANGGTLSGSGTLTQGANSTLTMNGSTFSLSTLNASATGNTVEYGANADQTVRSGTYHHLRFSTTGTTNTKTLAGAVIANGNIDIAGVTLDVSASNYSMTVSGDWTNTGTFTSRFGTVTFNGSSAQTITKSGGETFNNLVFTGTGAKNLSNPITVNFDMTIASSTTINTNGNAMDIKGNMDNSGTYNPQENNVTFSNNSIVMGSGSTTFNNITITGTLTGHSTNFNVTGDWINNGTFNHNNGKVTFSGTSSTISGSSTNTFNNIDIIGTLTVSSGNTNIIGNFNNLGDFNHNDGTLIFNGSSAQTIGGTSVTSFGNLTINNAAGVSLTSPQKLIGTLTLTSGTFTTTGQTFTLVSDASGTANIAEITSGDIAGNITMQRYLPVAGSGYKLIGASVVGTTLADWKDNFTINGFTGSTDSTKKPTIYTYNEVTNAYVKPTNITNTITSGLGYYTWISPSVPITVDVTSPPAKFNQIFPVSYTTHGGAPTSDGWNLLANPYPSTIDWDAATGWTKTNIDNAIYIWDPAIQQYASYVGGVGTNGGTRYIASSQAFWVKANAASPVLNTTESVKTGNNPTFFKTAQPEIADNLKISVSGNNYRDETVICFAPTASTGFDGSLDAKKKFSSSTKVVPSISTLADSMDMSINSLPELTSDVTIPLRVKVGVTGTYTLKMDSTFALPLSSCIALEDLTTGTITDLRKNSSYTFTIPNTTQAPRFLIHVSAPVEKQSIQSSCSGKPDGKAIAKGIGTGPFDYEWKDAAGNTIQNKTNVIDKDTLLYLSAGIYTVNIKGNNCSCGTLSDTLVITEPLSINPLITRNNVICSGSNDGVIDILAVTGGNAPYSFNWSNGETSQKITNLSVGAYTVSITDDNGCSTTTTTVSIQSTSPVSAAFLADADTLYLSNEGTTLNFTNLSSEATSYLWDFGDGSLVDASDNPNHKYSIAGDYIVSLIAYNEQCSDTFYYPIVVLADPLGIANDEKTSTDVKVTLTKENLYVHFNLNEMTNATISVYNTLGQRVIEDMDLKVLSNTIRIGLPDQVEGIFFIKVQMEDKVFSRKVFFQK